MFSKVHPAHSLLKTPQYGAFGNYDISVMRRNPKLGTNRTGNVSENEKLADINGIFAAVTIITIAKVGA